MYDYYYKSGFFLKLFLRLGCPKPEFGKWDGGKKNCPHETRANLTSEKDEKNFILLTCTFLRYVVKALQNLAVIL